jgi:unsaturated chondroitin disaccharide hydrolase
MGTRCLLGRVGLILFLAAATSAQASVPTSLRAEAPEDARAVTDPPLVVAQERSDELLETAAAMYAATADRHSPEQGFPHCIRDGVDWDMTMPRNWTSGFMAGILWMLHDYFEDDSLLDPARRWTEALWRLTDDDTALSHDIGFIANCSFGLGHRFTGSEDYRATVLEWAETLAGRFDPTVGAIKSWGAVGRLTYPVIIDNMMNLELLFCAASIGGSDSLAYIARTHAATTMRDHVREDGTTFHVVDYDPGTGEVLWKGTVQGLADTSTWSRGQAWGIYGFTVAYRETGDERFLTTACSAADAFIERLPDDLIPVWDFDANPWPIEPKDASAAAIAASGLWQLGELAGDDGGLGEKYRSASLALVKRLSEEDYSAHVLGMPALLHHSTGNRPLNIDIDVPMIYAEYYFIEALIRQSYGSCAALPRPTVTSYPNPFNPETVIRYELPRDADVTVGVYDVAGRLVAGLLHAERQRLGPHWLAWGGTDGAGRRVASGVYFVRVEASGEAVGHKLILLK